MISSRLRILVVDDSLFFRHRIAEIINSESDLTVIGSAINGKEAIEKVIKLRPDIVTMDVEMPVIDGISAVRKIMNEHPTRILMLSALTKQGAKETLESLEAGAVDFLEKDNDYLNQSKNIFRNRLLDKIRAVSRCSLAATRMKDLINRSVCYSPPAKLVTTNPERRIKLVVIGASTGGPNAIQAVLMCLPRSFSLPVLVAVHMPPGFTAAYADRLNTVCALKVREATDLSPVRAGQILVAPGGKQMIVTKGATSSQVRIKSAKSDDVYHPSIDQLFLSAANSHKNQVLAMILTGMGSDGLEGSRQLKNAGSKLWCQDKSSCVVYGMPQVVVDAGLSDRVLPLERMGPELLRQL